MERLEKSRIISLSGGGAAAQVGATTSGLGLPLFPGFKTRMFHLVVSYWIVAIGISAAYATGLPLVIAGWLSPTTLMLWPVGRKYGLKYGEYRTPWFVASVISMAGVPLLVAAIIASPMTDQLAKHAEILTLIAIIIGAFGVEVAHRRAFGKPVKMFFRPDLILGSNRILAGGLASLAIGMKFIFTNGPPGNAPIGNWYAFFLIILLGLYQLIPLRGLTKMRTMVSRMIYGKKTSYGITALKELYLVVAISLMLFGAHNFFGGVTPFTRNVLAGSPEGLAIMIISGTLMVLLRSWYKKHLGDPFFKETASQSFIKDLILVVGMTFYFYGFINVMIGGLTVNLGPNSYLTLIGLGLYIWGVILLIPLRAWARQQQKFGIMEQMMNVVLPSLDSQSRKSVVKKIVTAISEMPEKMRLKMVRFHMTNLQKMPDEQRQSLVMTQMIVLSELPSENRARMMKAMDSVNMQT